MSADATNNPNSKCATVEEFCRSHKISRALFYSLLKQGRAPRIMKLGRRTLISDEAAAEWRRRMEAEAA